MKHKREMSFESWTEELDAYLKNRETPPVPGTFTKHLFHYTWGDPGFWCQLGVFLVAGVVFRSLGFGDGVNNGVLLDASTFILGFYIQVTLCQHVAIYEPREQAGSALNYAHKNFPTRMVIVPFTSTFVPLLYGWAHASMENIVACWAQHFVALMFSYWSLAPTVVNDEVEVAGYAKAARRVEELKVRLSALGPWGDVSDETITKTARARRTKHV